MWEKEEKEEKKKEKEEKEEKKKEKEEKENINFTFIFIIKNYVFCKKCKSKEIKRIQLKVKRTQYNAIFPKTSIQIFEN